jgi:glucosyltransferase
MRHSIFFSESNSYPIYDDLETWIKNTGFVAPQTWVVRTNLWVSKPNMTAVDGTYLFFAYFLYKSKVCCLKDETTAVYRIVSESASHTKSLHKYYNYLCGIREEQLFLAREYIHDYNKSNEIIKCINDNFYKKQVRRVLLLGSKRDVMSTRKQFFDQKGSNKILLIVTFIIPLSIFRNVYLFYLKKRYNHED